MKYSIILFFITAILISSCDFPNSYKYVEIVDEVSIFDGSKTREEINHQNIRAKNDSIAYTEAFRRFCITQHVYEVMKKQYPETTVDIPIDFMLIKDKVDIRDIISFVDKDSVESRIKYTISLTGKSLLKAGNNEKTDSIAKAEAAKRAWENRAWKLDYFVDEFGDPTSSKYIYTRTQGTFSNSAVSSRDLFVKIFVTKTSVGVFLHERSWNSPAEKFIGEGSIMFKDSKNEILRATSNNEWNQSGGISIDSYYVPKVKEFLKNSIGSIKVVVMDEYSSTYSFSVNANGFTSEYSRL